MLFIINNHIKFLILCPNYCLLNNKIYEFNYDIKNSIISLCHKKFSQFYVDKIHQIKIC